MKQQEPYNKENRQNGDNLTCFVWLLIFIIATILFVIAVHNWLWIIIVLMVILFIFAVRKWFW